MTGYIKNPKTLLLVGGSGFLGSALGERFTDLDWNIRLLTRKKRLFQTSYPCTQIEWDGTHIPESSLKEVDAIINLAGEGIFDKSWSKSYRKRIKNSRVLSSKAMVNAINSSQSKPTVVVQASAVGFFGLAERNEECYEDSNPGEDFLAHICKDWEAEAKELHSDVRLCVARLGVVFGWAGGAFPKLWDTYSSGIGSVLGSGKQWMNWVHLEDVLRFFVSAVLNDSYSGFYNLVAPENISNKSFHQILSKKTPSFKWMFTPGFVLKAALGGRSDLLLKSPNIKSEFLQEVGFEFKFPNMSSAVIDLLSEKKIKNAHYLHMKQWIPVPINKVWDFFSSIYNLEKITPPWLKFKIRSCSTERIKKGTQIKYDLSIHGVPFSWRSNISIWNPQNNFSDEQEKGPYKIWSHSHIFQEIAGGTLIEDRVEYQMPLFPFGQVVLPFIKKDLSEIFTYRRKAIAKLLCN